MTPDRIDIVPRFGKIVRLDQERLAALTARFFV